MASAMSLIGPAPFFVGATPSLGFVYGATALEGLAYALTMVRSTDLIGTLCAVVMHDALFFDIPNIYTPFNKCLNRVAMGKNIDTRKFISLTKH